MSGYDPRGIANLLLEVAEERGILLTNLSLQKLLYFAHAAYLARHREPLVHGAFEAWGYGPVCRIVYDELKQFGREAVRGRLKKRDVFSGVASEVAAPDSVEVRDHVVEVVRTLGRLSPGQLVDLSHREGGAWDEVWKKSTSGPTVGNRISDKLTLERFHVLKLDVRSPSPHGDLRHEATPFAGD